MGCFHLVYNLILRFLRLTSFGTSSQRSRNEVRWVGIGRNRIVGIRESNSTQGAADRATTKGVSSNRRSAADGCPPGVRQSWAIAAPWRQLAFLCRRLSVGGPAQARHVGPERLLRLPPRLEFPIWNHYVAGGGQQVKVSRASGRRQGGRAAEQRPEMPHTAGCNLALRNRTAARVPTARGLLLAW